MSFPSIDFFPSTDINTIASCLSAVSIDECDRHLDHPHLADDTKRQWLCLKAKLWIQQRQLLRALSCCNDALIGDPTCVEAIAHRGLVNESLGYFDLAIADYERALATLAAQSEGHEFSKDDERPTCDSLQQQIVWLWQRKGSVCRSLKHYADALESYNAALAIRPTSSRALSGRGIVLALMGRSRDGLRNCKQAVQLLPHDEVALNSLGITLMFIGNFKEALQYFDRALESDPVYRKAWNNRAIALARLGRNVEVLESLTHALSESSVQPELDTHESWYAPAWTLKGITHLKLGQFSEAIESCEHSQRLDPTLYGAALCKLVSLVASGRIIKRLSKSDSRQQLWHDLGVVFQTLKVRLLILALLIGLIVLGSNTALAGVRTLLPTLLSVVIIALVAADLWVNRTRLNFVWRIYAKSGLLTYVRALGILGITLTTLAIAYPIAPPFMQWGWATAVFGQSGNLIFQPFNLLTSQGFSVDYLSILSQANVLLGLIHPLSISIAQLGKIGAIIAHPVVRFDLSLVFIFCFWLMLMIGIPFWAQLEERIFRQGANTWRKICIRSVQFGLIHILVGIPILAGFVLIVPGFLFACRYKYVYSSHLKRHRNPIKAQEAGMLASTADHAVYNAILVTFIAGTFAFSQMLT